MFSVYIILNDFRLILFFKDTAKPAVRRMADSQKFYGVLNVFKLEVLRLAH